MISSRVRHIYAACSVKDNLYLTHMSQPAGYEGFDPKKHKQPRYSMCAVSIRSTLKNNR